MAIIMRGIRCADCGSSNVTRLADGAIHCNACGKVLPKAMPAAMQHKIDTASFTGLHSSLEAKELKRRYRNAELPDNHFISGALNH